MRTVRQLLESKAPEVFAIGPDAPVLDAVKLMADKRIGALLVMQRGRMVGIVSERDYARKIVLQGRSSATTPVSEIMTGQVVSVRLDDTAERCMQLVTDRRIRHLPVLVGGTFKDPSFRPDRKRIGLRGALALVLGNIAPPAAVLATLELGPGEDSGCGGRYAK